MTKEGGGVFSRQHAGVWQRVTPLTVVATHVHLGANGKQHTLLSGWTNAPALSLSILYLRQQEPDEKVKTVPMVECNCYSFSCLAFCRRGTRLGRRVPVGT